MRKAVYTPLPVTFKKEWLRALRSGKYQQHDAGYPILKGYENSYNAIGVACEISGCTHFEMINHAWQLSEDNQKKLPKALCSQFTEDTGDIVCEVYKLHGKSKSFKEIADFIEKNY